MFTCGADILAVGLNVTHQVVLTGNSAALKGCILSAQDACCIKKFRLMSIRAYMYKHNGSNMLMCYIILSLMKTCIEHSLKRDLTCYVYLLVPS